MKKLLLTILSVAFLQSVCSQENTEKQVRFDLQLLQHIGISNWSSANYVNDGLPAASITELRIVLNHRLFNQKFHAFADLGMGIMPAPGMKSFNPDRMQMPYSGTQYYLREIISESGSNSTGVHAKFTIGFLMDFQATEKLTIMPCIGVGTMSMEQRSYNVVLKEHGSNMQYDAQYVWGYQSDVYNYDSAPISYLTGRLNFKHKISPKSNLLFGLEYTYFLDTLDFHGSFSNTFNGNIYRDFTVKGNKMNMLGVSVGISL